jgi:hypothetical protein
MAYMNGPKVTSFFACLAFPRAPFLGASSGKKENQRLGFGMQGKPSSKKESAESLIREAWHVLLKRRKNQ